MSPDSGFDAAAVAALQADAGCAPDRATALVAAVRSAAADEALAIVAGDEQPVGSAVDRRVATLHRVIGALDPKQPLPNGYEIGVIFRITPSQARSVLSTYQARFSKSYRARLQAALAAAKAETRSQNDTKVYVFTFNDPAVLDYALDRLRRRGLTRSVVTDRVALSLTVSQAERDRFDLDARAALQAADPS